MTNKEIKSAISKLKQSKRLWKLIENSYPDLYLAILENTSFLKPNATFKERLYCVKNNLIDIPYCKHCKKEHVNFNYDSNCYRDYCSVKCSVSDPEKKKIRAKNISKAVNTLECKTKIKKTRSEKYGAYSPADWLERTKQTRLERYGNPNYVNPNKSKETKSKRYGDYRYAHVDTMRQKSFEKYGVDWPTKSDEYKNRMLEKTYARLTNKQVKCIDSFETFKELYKSKKPFHWKCEKCGTEFEAKIINGNWNLVYSNYVRCPTCYPYNELTGTSNKEKALGEFIKNIYNGNIEFNSKSIISPYELGIYIPEKKLAIEFDGLYWHSNINVDKDYHLMKTERCEAKGIQLIHIFEDEWDFQQDIVKSRLKNLFGIYEKTIYARKCEVKHISPKTVKKFLQSTHIQGYSSASVNYGLYYDNLLIAVMTFGKSRFNKNYDWELIRFSTLQNYHIIGGAGKLLKAFEKEYRPKTLISYADRRWSLGKLYQALGFSKIGVSQPNYWYMKTNNLRRESRMKYQKFMLSAVLDNFNPDLTEYENMLNNNYVRIYDCGNLVFAKIYQS